MSSIESATFDIVIATRNSERFLEECLQSVTAQDVHLASVTVVDAASTDSTRALAAKVHGVDVVMQMGTGLANAWNQGIRSGKAEFVALIDSDDVWSETYLHDAFNALASRPDALCAIAQVRFFLDGNDVPVGFRAELLGSQQPGWMPGSTLLRRQIFDLVGMFPEDLEIATDIEWFARLRKHPSVIAQVPTVGLHKRIHAANLSLMEEMRDTYHRELLQIARSRIRDDPSTA